MKKEIEDRIIGILREKVELESNRIANAIGLTYDTTSKYLLDMTRNGILIREARGKTMELVLQIKKIINNQK